jgi:putative glutamine amidotransferase
LHCKKYSTICSASSLKSPRLFWRSAANSLFNGVLTDFFVIGLASPVDKIKQSGYGSRASCGGTMHRRPLVIVPADRKMMGHHAYHSAGEKYLSALVSGSDVIPMIMPSLSPSLPLRETLENVDGVFLTGSYSNIEPHHYSNEASYEGNLHDRHRDENSLSIIPLAIEMQIPVFAVCRGFQEANVALGGSLHQKVHEVHGLNDHRENLDDELDMQYADSHLVSLKTGGLLANLAGKSEVMVNSLHGQGINRLANNLKIEATAPDGLIEAVSLKASHPFFLAVQWHPEWKVGENPFYLSMFQAFGRACRDRAHNRKSL